MNNKHGSILEPGHHQRQPIACSQPIQKAKWQPNPICALTLRSNVRMHSFGQQVLVLVPIERPSPINQYPHVKISSCTKGTLGWAACAGLMPER